MARAREKALADEPKPVSARLRVLAASVLGDQPRRDRQSRGGVIPQ